MKYNLTKLFCTVIFLSLLSLTNLYAQDKLVGTWERTGDNLAGVKIKVFKTGDSFRGKIVLVTQSMIGGCFKVGEIKSVSYTHLDVYKRQALRVILNEVTPTVAMPGKSLSIFARIISSSNIKLFSSRPSI